MTSDHKDTNTRVWKDILGISQDLTEVWYGIRENAKYLDGIRDLTTTLLGNRNLLKVLARDAVLGEKKRCSVFK